MAGFVLFAFHFLGDERNGKWPEVALTTVFLAIIVVEFYVAFSRQARLGAGYVEFREAWLDVPYALGFLGAHVLFAKSLVAALARNSGKSQRDSIIPAIFALLWPPQKMHREAAAARAFFYVAILPLSIGLNLLAKSYDLIDWSVAELLNTWVFLLTLAAFSLVYLNYVPERSSFRVKLVGVTLTVVLSISGGFSWLIGNFYADVYRSDYVISSKTALRFEPGPDGAYSVARTGYYFDTDYGVKVDDMNAPLTLPFAFPFYGELYRKIFARRAGIVGFDHIPLWRNIQHHFGPQPTVFVVTAELADSGSKPETLPRATPESGMFVRRDQGRVMITWNRLVSVYGEQAEYTFQLRLYPTGVIEMVYADIPDQPKPDIFRAHAVPMMTGIVPGFQDREVIPVWFATGLPFTGPPGAGLMEYYRMDFLRYLDRIYQPTAVFILVVSLLILIVFPWFFQVNVIQPLHRLIDGVRQILNGNLATSIEVSYRDEIGFLASSFNEMAQAQNELVHSLEDKVARRTAEASGYAAKNARLEERGRWTRELHDSVSQTLFSANLIADTLPEHWQNDPALAKKSLDDLRQLNKGALAELRHLILASRPERFSTHSFGTLLQEIVKNLGDHFLLPVSIQIDVDATLPDEVQTTFYRIARECLLNAAKHAKATNVTVYFDGTDSRALLSVRDDGVGFDSAQIPVGHFGLKIMKERIDQIGGSIEVIAEPGKGALVTVIWMAEDGVVDRLSSTI